MLLQADGEARLENAPAFLEASLGIAAGPMRMLGRETVRRAVTIRHTHARYGRGLFADVTIVLAPLAYDTGFHFEAAPPRDSDPGGAMAMRVAR